MGAYVKGNVVVCTCYFEDRNGDRIVPEEVSFKVKNPNGTITEYTYLVDSELEKDDDDLFSIEVDASISGQWYYRFESIGEGQAANESEFIIRKGQF